MSKELLSYIQKDLRSAAVAVGIIAALVPQETYEPGQAPATYDLQQKRCYDEPQPKAPDASKPTKPIRLSRDAHGGIIGQEIDIDSTIIDKTKGATVKLANGGGSGSGYIAEIDKNTDTSVIVTAAHVMYDASKERDEQTLASLSITDSKGNAAKVVSGCYMEESNGAFEDVSKFEVQRTDIAVLRVSPAIGTSTLKLADSEPKRGSWDPFFYNYQSHRNIGEPASYGGIVLNEANSPNGYHILTGITSYRNCSPTRLHGFDASPCAAEGGSSGGAVVDRDTGDIIGISVAGQADYDKGREYLSRGSLKSKHNVDTTFEVGPNTDSWPVVSFLVPTDIIHKALESTAYNPVGR